MKLMIYLKTDKTIQSQKIASRGGLTPVINHQIANTKPDAVSLELSQKNIDTDFRNNKLIAWASKRCVDLIELINKKYNVNFGLPKGIYAEDFCKLKVPQKNAYGFCNLAPVKLYADKTDVVPEKTIFFNAFENYNQAGENKIWCNIDKLSNFNKAAGMSVTNSFFEIFMHEFAHVMHENNLINKLGGEMFLNKIQQINQIKNLENFRKNYAAQLSSICSYAANNPLDAVACDLSARIINGIELETSYVINNFVKNSPYDKNFVLKHIFSVKDLGPERTLNQFWNGNFKI